MHADSLVACGHQWDWGFMSRAGSVEMSQYSAGKEKTSEGQTEKDKGKRLMQTKEHCLNCRRALLVLGPLFRHYQVIWLQRLFIRLCMLCCECVCISSPMYALTSKLCVCVFCLRVQKYACACTCLQSVRVLCTLSCKFQSGVSQPCESISI